MIKANELRIGNYAYQDGELIAGVCSNTIHKSALRQITLDPIFLTTEILQKCGFEYVKEASGYTDNNHIIYECGESGEFWWEFHPFCTNDESLHLEVRHLHELQNLIFALTGEELEYEN